MAGQKTAETARPLTEAERAQFQDFLARDSAHQAPAVRAGDPYVALTNLSVPRRGGDGTQNDLVLAGEVVHLTKAEAAQFMRHGRSDGRQMAAIVPQAEHEAQAAGRIPPRAFSGPLTAPPADARPDPAGSSAVQVIEQPAKVPESSDPVPGTENTGGQAPGGAPVDAEDILPARVRARQQNRG